ncbi:aldose 1-epimerase [uncultured Algibacter sp.]|uniref:aldose 1-epimerase n=1 Tax=uncultured Algibacter sp. TaxID=298659 RepID=UPI002606240C|nr:aldose 1-epimerase [uncultured Algibacter sp.]
MYQTKLNQKSNILEISNLNKSLNAKIHLNQGASLQELTLDGKVVIGVLNPLVYADTYASAILFPFANRIKDGAYAFNGEKFQLDTNQKKEQNALHGLVYNKTFKVISENINEDKVSVELSYTETYPIKGFPYTYRVNLVYTFTKKSLNLNVSITNTDSKSFPFTLGWHPYFLSENLYSSSLNFSSNKKIVLGERNITTSIEKIEDKGTLDIKDKQLDDCWVLNSNKVQFNTPDYKFVLDSSEKDNFLQVYTPPKKNVIAIEPTTGVSDSFNNKIGLKILKPNAIYNIIWNLNII